MRRYRYFTCFDSCRTILNTLALKKAASKVAYRVLCWCKSRPSLFINVHFVFVVGDCRCDCRRIGECYIWRI